MLYQVENLSEEPFKEVVLENFNCVLGKRGGYTTFWEEVRKALHLKYSVPITTNISGDSTSTNESNWTIFQHNDSNNNSNTNNNNTSAMITTSNGNADYSGIPNISIQFLFERLIKICGIKLHRKALQELRTVSRNSSYCIPSI